MESSPHTPESPSRDELEQCCSVCVFVPLGVLHHSRMTLKDKSLFFSFFFISFFFVSNFTIFPNWPYRYRHTDLHLVGEPLSCADTGVEGTLRSCCWSGQEPHDCCSPQIWPESSRRVRGSLCTATTKRKSARRREENQHPVFSYFGSFSPPPFLNSVQSCVLECELRT